MAYLDSPSNVDGFSRYFADAFNENNIIMVMTGFLAMFSRRRPVIKTDAEVVDIDIVKGNEKTAKFIIRGTVGEYLKEKNIGTGKFTNISRRFPLSEEEWALTAEELGSRMAGENPYEAETRLMRMRDKGVEAYHRMIERTVRAWEIAAAESALTGKQSTILGTSDPNFQLDYRRDPNLLITYAAGDRWDAAGVNPITDIDEKITTLIQIGKVKGDFCILMGEDASAGFWNNDAVKEAGDNRRIYHVEKNDNLIAPRELAPMIAGGMTYVGKFTSSMGRKVHIMTYSAYYDDDAGTSTPYMAPKSYLLTPLTYRADRYFGPPDTLPVNSMDLTYMRETFGITPRTPWPANKIVAAPGVVDPGFFYTDAYPGGSRKNAVLRVQSAPIFATTQTDAFLTGNGVVA